MYATDKIKDLININFVLISWSRIHEVINISWRLHPCFMPGGAAFLVPVCEETGHLWKELQEISGKSFPTMEILWIVPARSCAPLQRNQYGIIWK